MAVAHGQHWLKRVAPHAAFIAAFALAAPTWAVAEYELRVAMIFNIARFVTWPQAAPDRHFTLCTLGNNDVAEALPTLSDRQLGTQPIAVRTIRRDSDLAGCQLMYLAPDQLLRLAPIARRLQHTPTPLLTISDAPGFVSLGGMVQLLTVDGVQRFRINQELAQYNGLSINARLLQLALPPETD